MFDAFIFVSARQNILSPKGIRKHTPVASTLDDFLNESARLLQAPDITKLSGDKKTGDKKRRALFDVLCETRALLVYDNLETLGDSGQEALADFLRELLPSTCKAIITSRHPPDGEGAVRVELNRLKPKDAYAIIRSKMKDDSQLANKLRRVNESRWRDLYNEIEGLPLALIYTLGLMRARPTLTFDSALELLHANRNPDLLTFLFQTAQELFTRNDEFAVRLLSFFTPSATLEIWTEVAGIKPEAEMEATADRLAKLALVDIVDGQQGERRFALHPLARNYVQSKLLADAQAAREMGMRFAGYWLKYAKEHGSSDEAYKAYDLLDAEWSNLNEAEEWLWQMAAPRDGVTGDREAAGMLNELAAALSQFLLFCGRWDERIQLSSRAYEVMCALSNWREAGWRACEVAWIHCQRPADLKAASDWAEHCKEALAKGGGKSEEALGMQMRGFVLMMLKDYANAESLYLDALKIYSDLNKNESKASLLNYLGELNRKRGARGDYKRAKDYYSKALDLYRRMNLTQPMLTVTTNLGILAITHKPWKDARRWFKQALPLARQVRRQDLIAVNFEWLARFYEKKRNFKRAQELALEAQTIYEQLQHSHLARTQELVKKLKKKVRKQSR
jgi:tetratricopeptide (TPR) repeat protein